MNSVIKSVYPYPVCVKLFIYHCFILLVLLEFIVKMSEKDRKTAFTMSVMKRKLAKDDGQVNLKEMKKELTSKSEKDVSGKTDDLTVKAHLVQKL